MNIKSTVMKTVLLTGSTDGIGREAARKLLAMGHRVLLHGRNPAKLDAVASQLGVPEDTFVADLSDLSQVKTMVHEIQQKHKHIDVLVNNAGIFKIPPSATTTTRQGLDVRFVVNTIAPYILTKNLMSTMIPKKGRVINVSSAAQAPVSLQKAFVISSTAPSFAAGDDFQAYAQSKLAIMMWSSALAQEFPNHTIVSVNPASMIGTKMVKEAFGVPGKDLSVGADILVQAAVGDKFADASGKYFDNDSGRFAPPHPDARDSHKNREVVDAIERLLTELHLDK